MHEDLIVCPVEGCDYEGSKAQVSSHANAKADHPNWAEIKDQVADTTPSEGSEGGPQGGESGSTDEETGESSNGEASKGGQSTPESGSEAGGTDPSDEQTGESHDAETTSGGESGAEGADPDPQDSETGMDEEEKQWSKVGEESQDGETNGAVDDPDDGTTGSTEGDEGLGIPIPVSSTTLLLGVALLAMGVILYQWATLDGETGESGEIEVEQSEQTDESTPSEAGLITE